MKIFLDSSVVLAAAGSAMGASRLIFEPADEKGWILIVSPYVCEEVERNIDDVAPRAREVWKRLISQLEIRQTAYTSGFFADCV